MACRIFHCEMWRILLWYYDIKGTCINIIKAIYDKFTHTQQRNNESLFVRPGTRQGCPFSLLLFNVALEVLATAVRQEKKHQIGKRRSKNSLFPDDIILYRRNLNSSPKNYWD